MAKAKPYSASVLKGDKSQRTFTGPNALQVAMPLGGIGAGCICINGQGGFQDFSIRNRPSLSALDQRDVAFAVLHVKGRNSVTRVIEGVTSPEKIYNLGLRGKGFRSGGSEGMPRFAKSSFCGEFPFATVKLSDRDVPLGVAISAWSPMIPLDDRNSSIPCAVVEYTFHNRSRKKVDFEFSFNINHWAASTHNAEETRNTVIAGAGVYLSNVLDPNDEQFGSAAVVAVGEDQKPSVKAMWFRGGWFDNTSMLWKELSTGTFKPNKGSNAFNNKGRNGGSLMLSGTLKPGEKATHPVVMAWHFPNCNVVAPVASKESACDCEDGACAPKWRPYYAGQWKDAREVAMYVRTNYTDLRARTKAFGGALMSSTLPSYVLDAVSANLGILKSPTVLRQEDGRMWGWEGCNTDCGCCFGSCTHVWNYAQAFPHLFPQLERTLREQELMNSMNRAGRVSFRTSLPIGKAMYNRRPAADGQLGGIMKLYRDWQICGDRAWLKKMYPLAKKSLDYCIRTWDPKRQGVLSEPHHNTYDIEFWGADGMCTSVYLGALAAMAALARDVGKASDAESYEKLAKKGAEYLDQKLFNGEYYFQKVEYRNLQDKSMLETIAKAGTTEGDKLLKQEGPKYQYGQGCISDGVIGAWMAEMYGIDSPQNRRRIRRNLKAIFQYNFRHSLQEHANTQRPGFAMGDEPGLLLCSWPQGGKPSLPFVYSDEVWTGIEYQVASHLIAEGLVDEGLTIVKAVRSRYNGRTRNPWNEYECGNYYARAMASYALLASLSGFRYSVVSKTLWLAPKLDVDPFRTFFSAASGFGAITLSKGRLTIKIIEGELDVKQLHLATGGRARKMEVNVIARAGKSAVIRVD